MNLCAKWFRRSFPLQDWDGSCKLRAASIKTAYVSNEAYMEGKVDSAHNSNNDMRLQIVCAARKHVKLIHCTHSNQGNVVALI